MSYTKKEKLEISPEKSKEILTQVLAKEENKICADCLSKGPRWASWNIGVLLCIRCSGIHRSLGVHISRVKSVNLDTWNHEQLVSICSRGNGWAKTKYEANLPAKFKRPQTDSEAEHFIRDKYERLKFCFDGEVPFRSLEEFDFAVKRSSKRKKQSVENASLTSNSSETNVIARPKPDHSAVAPQQKPIQTATNGDFTQNQRKSNLDDLLGLHAPLSAAATTPFQTQEIRPSSDLTPDLFSVLQPDVNSNTAQQQQQATTQAQPSPMSKDTIMSLYGRNTGMMQANPYAMAGSYNVPVQQSMMGYPQRPIPPNMGYAGYNQQGMAGYPQQSNMQAMQQQYQWQQQQQMQMQMQNMQLGTNYPMPAAGGLPSFGSVPQIGTRQAMYGRAQNPYSNMLPVSNQSAFSASQPSLTNQNINSWGGAGGQQMSNGQTLSSNLWK